MPFDTSRFCAVFVRPTRLSFAHEGVGDVSGGDEIRQSRFFGKISRIFKSNKDADLTVSVFDSGRGLNLNDKQQQMVQSTLNALSVGGDSAERLSDDRFAVVHKKSEGEDPLAYIHNEVKKATNLNLDVVALDTGKGDLSSEDGLKALVYSLKQFATGEEGYNIKDIKDQAGDLIGRSRERVVKFREMLRDTSFNLVYQPIVSLKTNKVHHYEALSRFDIPGLSESPYEIIRFAEDIGLIDMFDMAVLRRALLKLRNQKQSGIDAGIAVNLSGYSLSKMSFLKQLLETLQQAQDIAPYLVLEITETALVTNLKALKKVLRNIQRLGVSVYLDDFGVGTSGLQYLRELRPDGLKIDGLYIREAVDNPVDRAFLKSMVGLCRDLNIVTVGECVEDAKSAELLARLGVDLGQGYYWGRPVEQVISYDHAQAI